MRIGSLFSGAGGLDMAVEAVFGGEVVWQSEMDKAASKVLAYRYTGVPNLGDITKVNLNAFDSVDVLCGGFPCQDVSAAGKRAGIKDGTRSGLWSLFAEVIDRLRPPIVVIENVRGLLSARAHRNVEPANRTVGDQSDGPVLRAAGAVLGDLADLGYDAQWATVAAGDVGAPHRRERVFIVASQSGVAAVGQHPGGTLGTETRQDAGDRSGDHRGERAYVALLPTPSACNPNDGEGTETWLARREVVKARVKNGNGMGMPLAIAVQLLPTPNAATIKDNNVDSKDNAEKLRYDDVALLPTPRASDPSGAKSRASAGFRPQLGKVARTLLPNPNASDCSGGGMHPDRRVNAEGLKHSRTIRDYALLHNTDRWGKYAPAIHRWEQLTRPAPPPTEPNKNGNPRLSAAFSEWLMGWPAGWVTDPDIGISRNDQLRIVGNGVVPQQAIAALTYLLKVAEVAA